MELRKLLLPGLMSVTLLSGCSWFSGEETGFFCQVHFPLFFAVAGRRNRFFLPGPLSTVLCRRRSSTP
ncbi:hypothetical protein EWM60_12215 [Candidatus Erwinia dacicola]|nr:hypothetical protein [Candidatus Erwinia dacicola]